MSQAFTNRIEPRVYPTVEHLVTADGKSYIRATFSGDERPYVCDGRYRIRSADEDLPMSAAALETMMLERATRQDPWDGRPSGRSLSEVGEEMMRAYVERGVERRRIPFGYTDARDVLARLRLLCDDGCLTNAAAACFCPSNERHAAHGGVLADSERVHILDNRQETGTLFQLVETAELYILNNIRRAFVIDGSSLHREEVPEIPLSVIREALFNAFCHRRYEDDAAIQIDIFWDAVDIYSPGSFPARYAPEDYLSGAVTASKPRNQLIARTLYRSGDIETYGTGLRCIKAACDAQGVPVEVFERAGSMHVWFTRAGHRDGAPCRDVAKEAAACNAPLASFRPRGLPGPRRRASHHERPGAQEHEVAPRKDAQPPSRPHSGDALRVPSDLNARVHQYPARRGDGLGTPRIRRRAPTLVEWTPDQQAAAYD